MGEVVALRTEYVGVESSVCYATLTVAEKLRLR
jgi:hypothetical protein